MTDRYFLEKERKYYRYNSDSSIEVSDNLVKSDFCINIFILTSISIFSLSLSLSSERYFVSRDDLVRSKNLFIFEISIY